MIPDSPVEIPAANWLIRIPEVFAPWTSGILAGLGPLSAKALGPEYHLIRTPAPERIRDSTVAPFIQWNLPVQHSWPCHPPKMENFIEKAAQTLLKKFGEAHPQAILMGPLQAGAPDRYYKSLASNLRGRTLQVFGQGTGNQPVESLDPDKPVLYVLTGKEGLFAGLQPPRLCNGFHPGGTKFISQGSTSTVSRAGAKIAEALHWLRLHRPGLPEGLHWLELGASPGGMTAELLDRGQKVTALDRAPLDQRLQGRAGLTFVRTDAASFSPPAGTVYDALLCDMNGDARHSLRLVLRLVRFLKPGAPVLFTLKTPGTGSLEDLQSAIRLTLEDASRSGLKLLGLTHLTYNRQEFTCFLEAS